ncbi:MAG: phosphate acyltransferase PlsX [Candidatus Omnitrophica bacterium]|nr:phosphate acyltransferase PlsX [Candidatus Omnitrophota bacterium]
MKIVVDAMGGDYAPKNVIAGVVEAIKEFDVQIVLTGVKEQIENELKLYHYPAGRIEIVHTDEVVGMDEPATVTIRKKRNSSISVGLRLLKEQGYDAFISAGNTGAVVAAATFNLGMLPGVSRPAIGLVIPTLKGVAFIIDVGANADPKPEHLCQSGKMSKAYMNAVLGVQNPTVGLVNIGEEEGKGTEFQKESYRLMSESISTFIGNIEPNEIYKGKSDCIICGGFVGNVILKVSEGLMEASSILIKREIKKSPVALLGAFLMKKKLTHIKKLADYSEYGGAPLLGVNGIVMISHGRSSPKAIKNAIRASIREIEHKILDVMAKEVSAS